MSEKLPTIPNTAAGMPVVCDAFERAIDITDHVVLSHEFMPRRFRNRIQRYAHSARLKKLVYDSNFVASGADHAYAADTSYEGGTITAVVAQMKQMLSSATVAFATIIQHDKVMRSRASITAGVSHDLYEGLLDVADRLSVSLKLIARARYADTRQSMRKAAYDYDALAALMDAGAAVSEDMRVNVQAVLASLASLDTLAQNIDVDSARLCMPVSTLSPSALSCLSTVWRELPDGAVSTVSGHGMKSFVKGAGGGKRNVVLVYPRVSNGALAEYVMPGDVRLMFKDAAGSLIDARVVVERDSDGSLLLAYEAPSDCVNKLSLNVFVCGVVVGRTFIVRSGYNALKGTKRIISYEVGNDEMVGTGIAVNAAGSLMAVSYAEMDEVHMFRLTPSFERLCVTGKWGHGPGEFNAAGRLCFTDDDTILVCDLGNSRVQQLTAAGEYVSAFEAHLALSIAVHGSMVAVGTRDGSIEIHELATGELIRRFQSRTDTTVPDHTRRNTTETIRRYATGIRFSPDGACLLLAECDIKRVSLFTVDGTLIKRIVLGVLVDGFKEVNGYKDVSFGAGGEIIVSDVDRHRICVFSLDGEALIKTWGTRGTATGKFYFPTALAISGSYLYVMDRTRVQVFE